MVSRGASPEKRSTAYALWGFLKDVNEKACWYDTLTLSKSGPTACHHSQLRRKNRLSLLSFDMPWKLAPSNQASEWMRRLTSSASDSIARHR